MNHKKNLAIFFLALSVLVSGCGMLKGSEQTESGEKAQAVPQNTDSITLPEVKVETHEGEMISYLTGEWVSEDIGNRRPAAVMLSNVQIAVPQTGISKAGVIYEAPVEGGITRLMGVFEDYDALEKIGSVRSARNYFVYYAAEFDAVYLHYGQALYAEGILGSSNIDNLSGLEGVGSTVYYRTSDRKAPHNAYASAQGLTNGIAQKGYRTHYDESHTGHYRFAEQKQPVELENGYPAVRIEPGYSINKPYFTYSEEEKVYYRYQYGAAQVDDLDQSHLSYKNIIIQHCESGMYDDSYLNINLSNSGTGTYITNGRAINITWKKESEWGTTRYYDESGEEITLNPGRTWVCVVQNSKKENVSITE